MVCGTDMVIIYVKLSMYVTAYSFFIEYYKMIFRNLFIL